MCLWFIFRERVINKSHNCVCERAGARVCGLRVQHDLLGIRNETFLGAASEYYKIMYHIGTRAVTLYVLSIGV